MFISSLNTINFTENQKKRLIDIVKKNFETLCKICTFELDIFLIKIFDPLDLFEYFKILVVTNSTAVLQHILDILQSEDFSNAGVADEVLEKLKQEVRQKLLLL